MKSAKKIEKVGTEEKGGTPTARMNLKIGLKFKIINNGNGKICHKPDLLLVSV